MKKYSRILVMVSSSQGERTRERERERERERDMENARVLSRPLLCIYTHSHTIFYDKQSLVLLTRNSTTEI